MVSMTGSNPTRQTTASPPFPLVLVLGGGSYGAAWLMARQCRIGSAALNKGELNSPALGNGERKANKPGLTEGLRGHLDNRAQGSENSFGLICFDFFHTIRQGQLQRSSKIQNNRHLFGSGMC